MLPARRTYLGRLRRSIHPVEEARCLPPGGRGLHTVASTPTVVPPAPTPGAVSGDGEIIARDWGSSNPAFAVSVRAAGPGLTRLRTVPASRSCYGPLRLSPPGKYRALPARPLLAPPPAGIRRAVAPRTPRLALMTTHAARKVCSLWARRNTARSYISPFFHSAWMIRTHWLPSARTVMVCVFPSRRFRA